METLPFYPFAWYTFPITENCFPMSPFSLTPSQVKVSLFFTALLWFVSVLENNFYLMVLIPWAAFIFLTSWKRANPGMAIFEEKPEVKVEAKKEEAVGGQA